LGHIFDFDTNDSKLKRNDLTVGYHGQGFTGLLNLENLEIFSGSYYQKFCENVEMGIQASSKGPEEEDGPIFAIGGKYIIDPAGVCVRAKVDNNAQLGVGCGIKVTDGCRVFFSANVDLKNFAGPQKVGLGLDFQ
jgi:voltage-dependent anion channel protein 2